MKAIVCTKYGPPDVLKMVDIETPVPDDNQVLIKVFFTTVTVADCRVRGFNVPPSFWLPAKLALGWSKPRQPVLGTELSGVVEKAGKNVRKFKAGDAVFAYPGHLCGGYAAYICLNENACIALKPKVLGFEQAAALSLGGITAWFFLEKGKVTKGEKLLIYGASGSNGTAAVQIAKYLGAEVTAVCSTGNLEMVKNLGADKVIDYTTTDFTGLGEQFDAVFDTVGKTDIAKTIRAIQPDGRYLHSVTTPMTELKIRLNLLGTDVKLVGGTYSGSIEQIEFIKKLAEEGVFKPVIDRQYSFDEMVAAHEYVDKGHKKGNVTIKVAAGPAL
ncbi:MAG: NAD(P)-dependent alcohol dehydrogenase [Lewinellaceae bacterium]|nr:NAD(P)-dependent alcohol dehydrogenase [Lewinellaceae bacterium]